MKRVFSKVEVVFNNGGGVDSFVFFSFGFWVLSLMYDDGGIYCDNVFFVSVGRVC